jgi:hypothetical protein
MERLLGDDESVQSEIKARAEILWESHMIFREKIKQKEKDKFIFKKSVEEFEHKVYDSLTEKGKESDVYKRFIKEKIETIYLNKKVNEDVILKMRVLYPHYKKWFEDKFPRINAPSYSHVHSNFIHKDRLGKETGKEGWIGLSIKKD